MQPHALQVQPLSVSSAANLRMAHRRAARWPLAGSPALARATRTSGESRTRRSPRTPFLCPARRRAPFRPRAHPPARHPAPTHHIARRRPLGRQAVSDGLGRRGAPWHGPPHPPSSRRPGLSGARHALLCCGMPRNAARGVDLRDGALRCPAAGRRAVPLPSWCRHGVCQQPRRGRPQAHHPYTPSPPPARAGLVPARRLCSKSPATRTCPVAAPTSRSALLARPHPRCLRRGPAP